MRKFCVLLFLLFLFSCASIPKEEKVPKEMAAIDLIQKAQEAFEANNYRGAKKWYEIILKRFGDDPSIRVEAKYEIAHILLKQKKWKEAYIHLTEVIESYESRDGMRLPQDFYKLAKMDYEKVVKKLSPSYLQSMEKKAEDEKKRVSDGINSESTSNKGAEEESAITLEEGN